MADNEKLPSFRISAGALPWQTKGEREYSSRVTKRRTIVRTDRRRGSVSRILSPRVTTGGSDHSSCPVVAGGIVRPYPRIRLGRTTQPQGGLRRPRENPPIRSCSGWGLPAPWLTRRWSELLPRLFTLAALD